MNLCRIQITVTPTITIHQPPPFTRTTPGGTAAVIRGLEPRYISRSAGIGAGLITVAIMAGTVMVGTATMVGMDGTIITGSAIRGGLVDMASPGAAMAVDSIPVRRTRAAAGSTPVRLTPARVAGFMLRTVSVLPGVVPSVAVSGEDSAVARAEVSMVVDSMVAGSVVVGSMVAAVSAAVMEAVIARTRGCVSAINNDCR